MSTPRVVILRTAGTNCDEETAFAWQQAGADPTRLHVRELIEQPNLLDAYAILTLPGGFSYGDDISAGRILANQIVHHLSDPLRRFVDRGGLILGICNGFQALVKSGLLPGLASTDESPGKEKPRQQVTLAGNDSARFEARWVHLKTTGRPNAFLPPDAVLAMPVAHGEGKLVSADAAVRRRLHEEAHVAVTYCDEKGQSCRGYPVNPNGSEDDIAGLLDATGRVFGLMPHPERNVHPAHRPTWTSEREPRPDGRLIFDTAVKAVGGD